MAESYETTDIFICGCGPTGAMLSCCLGLMGLKHIIIDKEESITIDPRGIALDEDGIRALQSVGLYGDIYSKIGRCMGIFNFIGGVNSPLDKAPFTRMDYTTSEGGTGHVGFICHKQPALELSLRNRMRDLPTCDLRTHCTMTGVEEDGKGVSASYRNENHVEHRVRAKFLVGTDGKTGYVRKNYLESKGVVMQRSSKTKYEETWVAVNWKITIPTPATHPDFPLWQQGYTPEQVYDVFFPPNFRFMCNPQRPAVCGRFGLPEDRLWRFEFVVLEEEDGEQMATPEAVNSILLPYMTHSGDRYKLPRNVMFPADCIETLRSRPFVFSARSCNKWALGRTILCGDSAHVFPPFGGQGITSGFRDATALAWRLAIVIQNEQLDHEKLLTAWYRERKQQLERSLAATIENGNFVTGGNPIKVFFRDLMFAILGFFPSWRRWFEKGARREGMARYSYEPGMHFLPNFKGGKLLPQIYCRPLQSDGGVEPNSTSTVVFSDDVIFAPHKRGLFQLLVLAEDLDDMENTQHNLTSVNEWFQGYVLASEATFLIHNLTSKSVNIPTKAPEVPPWSIQSKLPSVFRIATADEFADSPLCVNRPPPLYYDEYRLQKEAHGRKFVIVRPDRFIFASCDTLEDLQTISESMDSVLTGSHNM